MHPKYILQLYKSIKWQYIFTRNLAQSYNTFAMHWYRKLICKRFSIYKKFQPNMDLCENLAIRKISSKCQIVMNSEYPFCAYLCLSIAMRVCVCDRAYVCDLLWAYFPYFIHSLHRWLISPPPPPLLPLPPYLMPNHTKTTRCQIQKSRTRARESWTFYWIHLHVNLCVFVWICVQNIHLCLFKYT